LLFFTDTDSKPAEIFGAKFLNDISQSVMTAGTAGRARSLANVVMAASVVTTAIANGAEASLAPNPA
jgi:hypothetical protein